MPAFLDRLTARERMTVLLGGAFVLSALLYGLVLAPALEKRDRWISLAERKKQELSRFEDLSARYQSLQGTIASMERELGSRKGGFSLLAQLEAGARRLGLQDNIASMKPFRNEMDSGIEESSVEIRLEKVDLGEFIKFLQEVEGEKGLIQTRRLRIKSRFDDPQLLDISILVSTLEAN
jgi:general secretion pathway protein M